jgi:tetratricopeptide (TPR) repeat protein
MNVNNAIKSAFENYRAGNLQQTVDICREILEIQPGNINALNLLGIVSYQQKDYDSAIEHTRKLVSLNSGNAQSYYILGHSLQEKGAVDEAITYYKKSLQLNPDFVDAHYNLGTIFQDKKMYDEGISCYQKVLQLNPGDVDAYYNLGFVLQEKGQHAEAMALFWKALQLNPNLDEAYARIGLALQETRQSDDAITCYRKAIELNPNNLIALYGLATVFKEKGHLDEAIDYYRKALKLDPDSDKAYNNMGAAFIDQGKFSEGIRCFKKSLELKPTCPRVLLNLARNPGLSSDDSKNLFELMKGMIIQDMSEDERIDFYFAMGKLCENLQMFKESFEYCRLGNVRMRAQINFNIDSWVHYSSRIKEILSADFIRHRKSWSSDSEMPIFIFGMPRSGTTLVEQILASHPNVYGAGELQFFNQVDQYLAPLLKVNEHYPECLNFIDEQAAYTIADLYIKKAREVVRPSKDYKRVTDKNLFNFYHLGLISLLFPKASFIHCQRHPLDTCLSIYFHEFGAGIDFAYDLSELGRCYLEYLKLMNHWRKVLPINIFELQYEDIVHQQEQVSRRLLEFCRLEWDPTCLDFYENDRPVFTSSNWQVRQPIYTTSCGRWQNYEQFLNPLKELLADFI